MQNSFTLSLSLKSCFVGPPAVCSVQTCLRLSGCAWPGLRFLRQITMIIDHIKHPWHSCNTKTEQVNIQEYLQVSIVCDVHFWLPSVPTSLEALFTLKFSCLPPMLHYLCTLSVPLVRPWIACGLASKKQKAQVNSLRLTVERVQSILAFASWLRSQQLLTFLQKLSFLSSVSF